MTRGRGIVLRIYLWSVLGFAISIAVGLVILWTAGVLNTSGGSIDWTAVASVAGVASALTSLATAAALVLAADEFDRAQRSREGEQQRDRIDRWPYVRADIGFDDYLHQPGFAPPVTGTIYRLDALALAGTGSVDATGLSPLKARAGETEHRLVAWFTNLQTQSLGIAGPIKIDVRVSWRLAGEDSLNVVDISFRLAYLAPMQSTGVLLAELVPPKDGFLAEVRRVRYRDIHGNESTDTHGAMLLVYNEDGVRNERQIQRYALEDQAGTGDDWLSGDG